MSNMRLPDSVVAALAAASEELASESNRHVEFFCYECGNEWIALTMGNGFCGCGSAQIGYRRGCIEDKDSLDTAMRLSESKDQISWEQVVSETPFAGCSSTIFGMILPSNWGIIARSVLDFDNACVTTASGEVVDIDVYLHQRRK